MTIKRKTIGIDMDGVLADTEAQWISWYEKETGIVLTKKELEGKQEHDDLPHFKSFRKYLYEPGFFRTLPVMEGAIEAVKELSKDFNIYIVSAAMEFPLSLYEKHQWLAEHFPFISWKNIIFCGDKSIIDVDYLIDDHCKNLDYCKGKPLMFTAFHNVNHTHHQRVNNWKEIPTIVRDLAEIRKKIDTMPPVQVPQRPRW
jgi:5'-nucleotidase